MARGELTPQEIRNRNMISNNLNSLLLSNNKTQSEISKATKIPKSTLTGYFKGTSTPNVGNIQKLADYFNVYKSDIDPRFNSANKINDIFNNSDEYTYFPYAAVSAGTLAEVDAMTENDAETICLSNETMGKYAGNKDIFVTRINGESMNNVIPDKSLVAIKKVNDINEFQNGDIVVFRYGSEMALKRFINDKARNRYIFRPDSSDDRHVDIIVSYEEAEMEMIEMYGKVAVYVVQL